MADIKTNIERFDQKNGTESVICEARVPRDTLLKILTDAGFEVSPSGRFLIVDDSRATVSIRSSGTHTPDPATMPQTPAKSTGNPAKYAGPQTLQKTKPGKSNVGLADPDAEVKC